MLIIGIGGAADSDAIDVHSGLGDTDVSFHFISITGITAFFLMFGLSGLAVMKKADSPVWLAVLAGLAVGSFTMWLIALVFSGLSKFQSDGTIRMENALGQEGVVYLGIPGDGIGKVQIVIQGGQKIFDARASDKAAFRTGDRVRVVSVTPDNMLIVEKFVS
jgi:membrane protein implicated in regulation of membrane protease activity